MGRDDDLDIEEVEKNQYADWLNSTIQALNDQTDEVDADLEALGAKKSRSNDEKSRLVSLKQTLDRHRWHVRKLELLLRALDNDQVEIADLAIVRDSVDFYVENHHDPDCMHDEGLYDCFDLHEYEEVAKPRTSTECLESSEPGVTPAKDGTPVAGSA